MHSRVQDLARIAACYRDDAANDNDALSAARGIWLALIVSGVVWLLAGMLAAIWWRIT